MKKITILSVVLMVVIGSVTIVGCGNSAKSGEESMNVEGKTFYQCPMDCENGTTYDKSGKCPVCGMDLEIAPAKS